MVIKHFVVSACIVLYQSNKTEHLYGILKQAIECETQLNYTLVCSLHNVFT